MPLLTIAPPLPSVTAESALDETASRRLRESPNPTTETESEAETESGPEAEPEPETEAEPGLSPNRD